MSERSRGTEFWGRVSKGYAQKTGLEDAESSDESRVVLYCWQFGSVGAGPKRRLRVQMPPSRLVTRLAAAAQISPRACSFTGGAGEYGIVRRSLEGLLPPDTVPTADPPIAFSLPTKCRDRNGLKEGSWVEQFGAAVQRLSDGRDVPRA